MATVDQENGSEINFSPYTSGTSPSWCSGATNYCANQPSNLATLNQNSGGSWTFVRYSGGHPTTFNSNSSGALVSEYDQAGDSLSAASETAGTGACPSSAASCTVWTSSASGRALTLAFDSSGRLLSANGEGNTVSYCYFGQSCADGATHGGSHDLYSAELPSGATTVYGYDYSDSNPDLVHDILTETLPTGGTVTNTFNASGQVASQVSPSDYVTLSYSGNNQSVSGGSTIVSSWPTGTSGPLPAQEVEYQFSSLALVAETTGYGTSAASTTYYDPDAASLVPILVQSGNGNQVVSVIGGDYTGDPVNAGDVTLSTDGMGNTTEYQYTADNQVWCEVASAEYLDGVTCPSSEPSSPPAPGDSDPNLGATINFYNSAGEETATTDALGRTTEYAYTGSGLSVPPNLQYCSVSPAQYAAGVSCPAYGAAHVTGTTSSTFDSAGDVLTETGPDGVAGTGTPPITAVGPLDEETFTLDASSMTMSDSPVHPGDLLTLAVIDSTWADAVTSVSGGGASSWAEAGSTWDDASDGVVEQIWHATVSTAGPSTLTIDFSGSVSNVDVGLQEFNAGNGATWSYASHAHASSPFPSLTASGSGELYFGAAYAYSGGAAGTTSGVTYKVPTSNFLMAWDTNVSGTLSPNGSGGGSLAALFTASGGTATTSGTTSYVYGDSAYPALPTVVTGPDGEVTVNAYNSAGELTSSTESFGGYQSTTVSAYDSSGNAYCTISALSYSKGHTTCPVETTLSSGAAGLSLPQSTVPVSSTTGFSTSSAIALASSSGLQVLSCTGTTSTSFTGCSGGTGTLSAGSSVVQVITDSGTDLWPGRVVTLTNAAEQTLLSVSALGGVTEDAYDQAGNDFCQVGPQAYSQGVTCPASPPTTAPTTSSDPYLGATITTYNPSGQVTQTTNPLGGITTSSYDADGNLSSQTVESTSTPTPTITAVGSPSGYYSTIDASSYSLADSPATTGDLMALAVVNTTWSDSVSSVSGGGVSSWTAVSSPFYDGTDGVIEQIWYGTVTTTGSSHITIDFTGSVGNIYTMVHEFSAGSGATWLVDTHGTAASPFPSLSATGAGELYFGAAYAGGSGAAGSTSGVTYYVPSSYFVAAWDTHVSGTLSPNGTGQGSTAALFIAHGASSSEPSVTTTYTYNGDDQQLSETTGSGTGAATALSYYDPDGNLYCSVSPKAYAEGGYTCPAWQASWASSVPSVSSLYSGSPPPANEVTTSFYDADGELVQESNPDQATTISVYNADGEVACAEDAADMAVSLASDPTGSYPYSCTGFNPAEPPTTGSGPGYEETIYDLADLVLSSTDADGGTTAYTYDPDGLVLTTTGPSDQVSTNCYFWEVSTCAAGAPANGGDAAGLYSTNSPPAQGESSGITTTYTYEPGGAAASKTTSAGTTTYGYDTAGDNTSVHYGSPASGYGSVTNISYSYNSAGMAQSMTDGTGTTTYAYDDPGDLLTSIFAAASGTELTSTATVFTYATMGQRASLTYPQAPSGGSATVSYAYNGNGQMSSLTDWAGGTISFGYDPDGNLTSVGYPNDTALSATYDLGDAETAVSAFTGTPSDPGTSLLGVSYSLNSAEQVSSETDTGAISSSVSYTYSPADRLGSVKVGSGSPASTAYNASGDPTTLADATTQSFNTDDQLTSATSASEATESYTYNATGDRTASSGTISGSATYGFGENDELATASVGSASVSYMYNGDGLLAGRTTLTATATDTWDTATGLPLLLSDGTNDYLYGPGGTVLEQASLASGTPEYYLSDGQGSTRALLGTSGSVAATFSFDTYGNLTSSTGSATTPLLYDGQYKDAATGLYYLRARWYDPGTGQFISVDPDVAETAQPYTYAADDSVNESDPTGLMLEYGGVGALSYLACSVASSGSETDFSTARRSECLFTQFLEKGYSQYAAAAVVGNIYAESAGTDAGDGGPLPATESNPMLAAQAAGTGCGLSISLPTSENANQAAANCENVGIAQWGQGAGSSNNSRVAGLVDYARQQGQPWWNFLTQVGYIFHELTSNTPVTQYTGTDVANTLKTCGSSLYNCTSDFMVEYEGPKGNSAVLRTTYAQLALNAWQGIASDGLTCDLWAGWQHAAIIAGGVI